MRYCTERHRPIRPYHQTSITTRRWGTMLLSAVARAVRIADTRHRR
ncbi:hypothetical protein THER5_1935 [Bifidobacterium thermacidophilum subsp. thermacidophilum]|uniref:Uncharacterized protein n=1 Tax=Bifidobacterium thermacidophilum subsp. thermacidophilum TaxID=79262 RepID=A0A087E3P6_9BIFI|nr:hypothetical protein THER5_1935 [Bifidobacterium thermacidophilum subsp. thermacidophilum]